MDFELSLKQTVEKFGLAADKALGQNFLLDQNVTDKIMTLSLSRQNLTDLTSFDVFEVGPGPGGLTRAVLSKNPKSLCVVEADERCVAIMQDLRQQVQTPFEIISGDALQTDFSRMGKAPRQIVSNLPYHISVPLLTGWLKNIGAYAALTLMFQKEVAERIVASVKTKAYGRLSVLAQLTAQIDKLMDLNPQCFVPAPKVWSSVLLTTAAFSMRRKMIRQSLKSFAGLEEACVAVGVPLTARAEEIAPLDYLKMARLLFAD